MGARRRASGAKRPVLPVKVASEVSKPKLTKCAPPRDFKSESKKSATIWLTSRFTLEINGYLVLILQGLPIILVVHNALLNKVAVEVYADNS